ncbi:Proline-specific permease [Dissostichus eleginoides]|uniref:Proline-specific permease n=1 Tax=Dissostichus eleginoides TaxID=100907 RepID=A0AAD9C285_DISEL|nr:Proline-specific permease [Dissostichus eleginoides]
MEEGQGGEVQKKRGSNEEEEEEEEDHVGFGGVFSFCSFLLFWDGAPSRRRLGQQRQQVADSGTSLSTAGKLPV